MSYPSDALRQVLHKTLGVPLFQEQAMRVAMVGAGFTGAEADELRRAMAAWKRSTRLLHFHDRIVNGMLNNGYTRQFAEQCFEQIKGFGEYGFPESHSASFARLVYVSAWLKRHHPAAFAAALINSQPMGFYQPAQIVRDAREHGVEVRPADVNESNWDCLLEPAPSPGTPGEGWGEGFAQASNEYRVPRKNADENLLRGTAYSLRHAEEPSPCPLPVYREREKGTWGSDGPALRLGLRMIKGLRIADVEKIVAARQRVGRFSSIDQFKRVTGLSRKVLRRLAEADTFASLGLSRREALWEVMKLSDVEMPLFEQRHEGTESPSCLSASVPSCLLPKMPLGQQVNTDYATIGLSLRAHPLALVREVLKRQRIITAADLNALPHGRWVKVAGMVLIRQRPGTASGIVFITLEDETGVVNLIVRPQTYDRYRPAARHAGLLQCDGYVERQGKVIHVMAKRLFDRSELISGIEFASRDFH